MNVLTIIVVDSIVLHLETSPSGGMHFVCSACPSNLCQYLISREEPWIVN